MPKSIKPLMGILLLAALVLSQCSDKQEEDLIIEDEDEEEIPPDPIRFSGSWTSFYPNLFHDGAPVSGENFIVYSDKSSEVWRQTVAGLAEESYADIKELMDVTGEDFDLVPTQNKIHILTNYDQWSMAVAYRDGIIIRSKDGPNFGGDHDRWHKVFQHEIAHVVEFMLIGEFSNSWSNSVWMREGFGNYGARNHRIQTVEQLHAWQEKMKDVEGAGNPILIEVWSDFPQSVIDSQTTVDYYGFFELAVRYLVDEENGNGTNIETLKAYFDDLGTGTPYGRAFYDHFGITTGELRNNYWTIMEEYLAE